MRKLRVLIVADSAISRRLLADALVGDPAIEVAGIAANVRIALANLNQLRPDLVILNSDAPESSSLAARVELRKANPKLPVLLFSAQTVPGVIAGGREFAAKAISGAAAATPVGSLTAAVGSIRRALIPKIKALCDFAELSHSPTSLPEADNSSSPTTRLPGLSRPERQTGARRKQPAEIVAIGVSTGGPNALLEIFRQLPADFPLPIVVVQHMPPLFTKYLAERLDAGSPLAVREAEHHEPIEPGGRVWLAPGNLHMTLRRAAAGITVHLHDGPTENSCRPSVDVLFRSVAEVYGPTALAVVLTGMGQDGLHGCEAIRAAGGRIIAQDEATSVVWGMPGAVAASGLADQVLPVHNIAAELIRIASQRRQPAQAIPRRSDAVTTTTALPLDSPSFDYVRQLVHDQSAIALEPGKEYLVESRLLPLARQRGLVSVRELVTQLQAGPIGDLHDQVVEAMTTNETSFFRDIHPFDALRSDVLPQLLKARAARKSLTIWSAACSSGQEPYSIAIVLREHFPQLRDWNVQIIASDLSQQMLDRAAQGLYSQQEVSRGLPAALLAKYFQKSGQQWQVRPEIRKLVRFVRMNLVERWPQLPVCDVIFLRNVLIYFGADTKRRILPQIRRQLSHDGALFLGGAETTLGIDKAWERINYGRTASYRQISEAPHTVGAVS